MNAPTRRAGPAFALGLTAAVVVFFALALGRPDAFLYRPGETVSDLTLTFWPNVVAVQRALAAGEGLPLWRADMFSGSPLDADPQAGLWYPPNVVFLFLPAAVGFNALFAAHTVLAGLGMWRWARALGASPEAAAVAGLAFAFGPRAFAHLGFGHVGLFYASAYIPWALWAAREAGQGGWRAAGALGLALGMQIILHAQIAFYTGAAAMLYGLASGYLRREGARGVEAVAPPAATLRDVAHGATPGNEARGAAGAPGNEFPGYGAAPDKSGWGEGVEAGGREAAGWSAVGRREDGRRAAFRALGGLAIGGGLALLVSAAQWLPLAQFAPLSARASLDAAGAAVSSLPPRYLWGLVLADHRGFMDYMTYAGLPVLALAVLALPARQARFWWIFVLAAVLYALGENTPLYAWAMRLLPAQGWLRAPARIWFVAAAALALMAGLGFDRLLAGLSGGARYALNLAAAGGAALAILIAAGYAALAGPPPANLLALAVVAPLSAALCMWGASGRLPRPVGTALVLALVAADLWAVNLTLAQGRALEAVLHDNGLGARLSAASGGAPFRVYSPSYSLPRPVAAQYALETVDGVDPLYLADYDAFVQAAAGVERRAYGVTVPPLEAGPDIADANSGAVPDAAMLGLLNARFVAAEFPLQAEGLREAGRFGSTYLYENELARPRAFVVGRVVPAEGFGEALAWVRAHAAEPAAVVQGGPPLEGGAAQAEVVWRTRTANRLELEATLDRPGLLVISQTWYPGWRARVNGQPATLWRAQAVLAGVYLQAGRHTVELDYRPRTLWPGVALSTLGIAGSLGLALKRKRNNLHD